MQMFFYNFSVRLYWWVIVLMSPFFSRAKKFVQGRKRNSYRSAPGKKSGTKRLWIHASSLGEFEQGRPLIEALRAKSPSLEIILTFFSPSGFEVRKN